MENCWIAKEKTPSHSLTPHRKHRKLSLFLPSVDIWWQVNIEWVAGNGWKVIIHDVFKYDHDRYFMTVMDQRLTVIEYLLFTAMYCTWSPQKVVILTNTYILLENTWQIDFIQSVYYLGSSMTLYVNPQIPARMTLKIMWHFSTEKMKVLENNNL